jgi:hypothetical protein
MHANHCRTKASRTLLLAILLLAPLPAASAQDGLTVYPPVMEKDDKDPKKQKEHNPSTHYKVRVRSLPNGLWKNAYAMETKSQAAVVEEKEKDIDGKTIRTNKGYFGHLMGWTHTYVNFETTTDVEVEITDCNGYKIEKAAVHPKSKVVGYDPIKKKANPPTYKNGKAYVQVKKNSLVAVDIHGQMDDQDTGLGFHQNPKYPDNQVHTISIFANPPLEGKPKSGESGVRYVTAGDKVPTDGGWTTLHFGPGVHNIGLAFPLRANCNYYIPGDAIVYGTFSTVGVNGGGKNTRIFGHGTLSGAKTNHPQYEVPPVAEALREAYDPIVVYGGESTSVDGITIADAAHHSINIWGGVVENKPNVVKWTKIINWRVNGDGINPGGNTMVEDCFIRTQDDSIYTRGRGISRTTFWNDANGSSFAMDQLGSLKGSPLVVKNCDVIYSRAMWHKWAGGRVFNLRGTSAGAAGAGVVFRNINIEDPRPTLQPFFICMEVPSMYTGAGSVMKSKPGDLSGVLFDNITIAAPSVLGEPQLLWGHAEAKITNLTFKNMTMGGKPMTVSDFTTNEFVKDPKFIK